MATFQTKSRRNTVFALAAVAYLALLYGTLGVTPRFFGWFLSLAGGYWYSLFITLFLIACGLSALAAARRLLFPLGILRAVGLTAIALGYAAIIVVAETPAVRLHALQYGLLAWLVTESLRGAVPVARVFAYSVLLTMAAGVGDETIQWLLPNRHGLLWDVVLDWVSAGLALGAIYLVRDYRPPESKPAG